MCLTKCSQLTESCINCFCRLLIVVQVFILSSVFTEYQPKSWTFMMFLTKVLVCGKHVFCPSFASRFGHKNNVDELCRVFYFGAETRLINVITFD